LEFIIR